MSRKVIVTDSVLDALNEMSPEDREEAAAFMRGFAQAVESGGDPSGTLLINGESVESSPVSDEEWQKIKASMTPEQRAEVEKHEHRE